MEPETCDGIKERDSYHREGGWGLVVAGVGGGGTYAGGSRRIGIVHGLAGETVFTPPASH